MSTFLRFWGLAILIVVVLVAVTILLMRKFKGKTMVIYIPTLTIWLISIMFFIMAIMTTESMRDLGYFVMSMITGIATFITLIATIIISKYRQRKVIK